jgi:CNT family concentrative nucleoside transporter
MKPPVQPAAPVAAISDLRYSPTPIWVRIVLLGLVVGLTVAAYKTADVIGTRGQAAIGVFAFFALGAAFSHNLRAVNWRTIAWGIALQLTLALLILKGEWTLNGTRYSVNAAFERLGDVVRSFINFSNEGAKFVFGNMYDARPPDAGGTWSKLFGADYMFQFAFVALPPILFVSAFFTVLYHYGILQWCVRQLARIMVYLMGTSGAETLSVSANVFMGQTEAPLIVKPYVPRMTQSEIFALMVSGMAHISGGMMVVYINYGADPVAVITTCVMACPCSLYLAKLILPETGRPETSGTTRTESVKSPYVNAIDAAAAGTTDGLRLALNVAAMLIVFIAFIAMFDALLGGIKPLLVSLGVSADSLSGWPDDLSLKKVFGWMFSPAAVLMGVEPGDAHTVGGLLGSKLAVNEHFAYLEMKKLIPIQAMSERSFRLAAFALTGFANFSSIGIQIGGIGAIAPDRRHDLARLGGRALFAGFLATLLNASVAGILIK